MRHVYVRMSTPTVVLGTVGQCICVSHDAGDVSGFCDMRVMRGGRESLYMVCAPSA